MRSTALALALLLVPAGTLPSQAQGWGWAWRPCYGFCRPWMGGGWAPPPRFVEVPAFAPGRWWNPRAVRWRRMMAREFIARRLAEEDRRAEIAPAEPRPTFGGWVWRRRPAPAIAATAPPQIVASPSPRAAPLRGEDAVAALPAEALHPAQRRLRPVAPSRVLAAAAMLRREAEPARVPVSRAAAAPPGPPPRPVMRVALHPLDLPRREAPPRAGTSFLRRPHPSGAQHTIRPVVLRSEPAPARPAPATAPAPSAPAAVPVPTPSADVPVAPLD